MPTVVAGRFEDLSAIHLAARGKYVLPRSAAAGGGVERLGERGAHLLTARETEVLELLQDGYTNSEIAGELGVGIETVRTHARSVYRKLGVASRRELTRMARMEAVVVDDGRRRRAPSGRARSRGRRSPSGPAQPRAAHGTPAATAARGSARSRRPNGP